MIGILVAADSTPTLNLGREETTGGVLPGVRVHRLVSRTGARNGRRDHCLFLVGGQLMVLAVNCALFG